MKGGKLERSLTKYSGKMETVKNNANLSLEEMVWKGVLIEESLEDKKLLRLVKFGKKKRFRLEGERRIMTFCNIEVRDEIKEKYVKLAMRSIMPSFYTHLCKDGEMYVVFRGRYFKFKEGDRDLERAREYGESQGILRDQMEFEYLINHPYGRSLFGSIMNRILSYIIKPFK